MKYILIRKQKKMILHNKPTISKDEVNAAEKVLKSGWIADGIEVKKFEDEFCKLLDSKPGHAAALSSGTAALYVTLVSLGIKKNDEVIIPTYVCSALLNAIYLALARPVLVDINPDDFNISFEETKKNITTKTKAIIIPHTFGMPADVEKFIKLGVPIIEDCAQAIGAKLYNRHLGTFGKAAIFSFYASKVLTTGYGGMVFSKDESFIEKIKDYREFDCRKKYKARFNFKMSDLQAAIGTVQLKKLPLFLKKREKIANDYYKILPLAKVWPQRNIKNKKPNFYRFLIQNNKPVTLKKFMEKKGIETIVPIETHELLHRYLNQNPHNFPISERVAKTTLSLPIHPSLTLQEAEKIKKHLKNYFNKIK